MTKKLAVLLVGLAIFLWYSAVRLQSFALFLIAVSALVTAIILRLEPARSAGVFVISALLSLSLAEWMVPLLFDTKNETTRYDLTYDYPYRNVRVTDLGQQPYSGVHVSRKVTVDGEEIYNARYTIGDDGFRITEPTRVSVRRINFLGCSFTFGEGLNDNETLPYFVNDMMGDVEVKNFGFHAWGPHQALALLESERDTSGQINFFMTIPWHVERSACKPKWTAGAPKYQIASDGRPVRVGQCWEDVGPVWINKVLGHSKVYSAFQELLVRHPSNDDYELYFALVEEMARISHSRGQNFIVGFIGANDKTFRGSQFSNEVFKSRLTEIADEVVDLTLVTGNKRADEKFRIHKQDSHPTALANRVRADRLIDVFNRWLDQRRLNR